MSSPPDFVQVPFLEGSSWDPQMHERVRWLRRNDPVHWSELDDLWLITRFEDVAYVSKDQDLFTSGEGVRPQNPARFGLIDESEPRHGKLRGLINRGFTPRMVTKLETPFLRIVTDAIDSVAALGECDFVTKIAVPLPLLLIAEMIGIRKEDRKSFHEWSDAMIAGDGNMDNPEIMAKAGLGFVSYSTYVTEIIEERRRNPQDDLVSILVGAKDDGILIDYEQSLDDRRHALEQDPDTAEEISSLHNDELIKMMVLLLVAGNETTRNGISGGMQLLIENPDQRQKLIDDPTLLKSAVEEMLRVTTPIVSFSRTVTRDTELRGKQLERGQKILLCYPSANLDPDEFEDPLAFRIDRNPQHVAFGIGNHFCLGANLARMEMRVALEQVLLRLKDMEYAGEGPVLTPSALVRTCAEMKVRFTPEA